VFGFGLPEVSRRNDFGGRLAGPEPGGVDVGDGIDRDALLFVIGEEDRRPVARADVVALPVARARIVDLEEKFQDFPEARNPGIEDDLDRLGVRAMIAIGCVRHVASGVPDAGGEDSALAPDQILHAPEAAARQHGPFALVIHVDNPFEIATADQQIFAAHPFLVGHDTAYRKNETDGQGAQFLRNRPKNDVEWDRIGTRTVSVSRRFAPTPRCMRATFPKGQAVIRVTSAVHRVYPDEQTFLESGGLPLGQMPALYVNLMWGRTMILATNEARDRNNRTNAVQIRLHASPIGQKHCAILHPLPARLGLRQGQSIISILLWL
jgi:hypothetical protein